MTNIEKYNELIKLIEKMEFYGRICGRLSFDLNCVCPKNNMQQAGEDNNAIGMEIFKIFHSKKFTTLVRELRENSDGLTDIQKELVKKEYKSYAKEKNISAKLQMKWDKAANDAYINWLDAKEKSDYSLFKPYLKKIVSVSKQVYLTRDEQKETLYDTILDDYEPGWSIKKYDEFFNKLKEEIVPLVAKVSKSKKKIRDDFLSYPVKIYKQEEFAKYLLLREGHNFDNLVLMTTEHPFTSEINRNDVRVTTHYYEDNFISNLYTIMHEGGHALFDLGEPDEIYKNHLDGHMTCAMHECMSRLFENMIARSKGFVHLIYPKFKELFAEEFKDVTEEELYLASNIAKPSLIRCDADELTYPLHIIIRYEMEKEFINGNPNFNSLNKKWNALYKQYLGIKVPGDKEGILQDVHWTDSYGYFPTYALGSAYAAQIYHRMNQDFDIEEAIRNDQISKIVDWLKSHAWNIASLKDPDEWIELITGEKFNPDYYINYLKEKFTEIYDLK